MLGYYFFMRTYVAYYWSISSQSEEQKLHVDAVDSFEAYFWKDDFEVETHFLYV